MTSAGENLYQYLLRDIFWLSLKWWNKVIPLYQPHTLPPGIQGSLLSDEIRELDSLRWQIHSHLVLSDCFKCSFNHQYKSYLKTMNWTLLSSFKGLDFQRSSFWSRTKGLASRCCTRLDFRHSINTIYYGLAELHPNQHRLWSQWTGWTRYQVTMSFFFIHTVLIYLYFLICYRDFSSSWAGSLVKTFSPCGTACSLFQAETKIQGENCFQQYVATSESSSVVWFRFIYTKMQKI